MEAGRKPRPVGYFRWHQIVWKFGGTWERILFVIYAATAYVFFPLVIAWLILTLLGNLLFPWEFFVTFGLALINIPSFFDVFAVGLYNTGAWSELLRRGYFHPHERLAAEYMAYLETVGVGGRLPGAVRLALAFWALFYGLVAASIIFAIALFPLLGPATPAAFLAVDASVVFASKRLYKRRFPILYGEPDPSGFRLSKPIFGRFSKG